ncbi:MAG: hypothetical protein KIT84_25745 [Labilithrix sp.]|nr:hypothetical protein [Labilithrix sp.]MCW5814457.1 hypothetical protein [Labilithrix sp.]
MRSRIGTVGLFALVAACGDRPDSYETPFAAQAESFALTNRVAVVDKNANRVGLLVPKAGQELATSFVPIGRSQIRAQVAPDGKRLFVLSAGDVPRRKDKNERPSLTVIDDAGGARRFDLESLHSDLALDPRGRYVALFAKPGRSNDPFLAQASFVENPNEILIVDLEEGTVTPRTIRSFGGQPQRVTFTDPLNLPRGQRRLLVVETDQDVHLLDLDNLRATPRRPEITVRLTSGSSTNALRPAAIAVDDGLSERNDDTRIGVRVENDSSVFTLTLVDAEPGPGDEPDTISNDFRPEVNLTEVGGTPGDIVFVRTDLGVRLAAVVPNTRKVVLFDPQTSITSEVDVNGAFSRISLITSVVDAQAGTDTALLYGEGQTNGVAFLSLGKAVGQTYRTVEIVPLSSSVSTVRDVPPPRPELKVLQGGGNAFFVLNLASRTAAPLTTLQQAAIHVAPDGQRLWAFQQGAQNLSEVTLDNLHPIPLTLDRPITAVYDVEREGGGRSLIALDMRGSVGATVLDAIDPDTTASRSYYGLMLEKLQ